MADTAATDVPHDRSAIRRLLAPEVRVSTVLLWAAAFLVFVTLYQLQSWIPTLVVAAVIGAFVTLGALFIPGVRSIEGVASRPAGQVPDAPSELLRPPALVDL